MSFDWLYQPLETVDLWLSGGFVDAGWPVVLLLAALLGLRHATDPDHLAAVTALVAGDEAAPRQAARLGAAWGVGHATVLVTAGAPLILLDAELPAWLESTAERLVGVLIIALALRVLVRWWRRPAIGAHTVSSSSRSPHQSAAIGALHGLGGTGAIVLLLLTMLPSAGTALLALALFAPMSAVSMALCTALYGRLLATPRIARVQARVGMPAMAVAGIAFGGWYAGLV
jgi:hypothetical protein